MSTQADAQGDYHRELFPAWTDWRATMDSIVDFTGQDGPSGLIGLDQMGHFGPQGCDRVVAALAPRLAGAPVRFAELGSGFGGALRYLADGLAAAGLGVERATGVDLVPEHCRISAQISTRQHRGNVDELCAPAEAVPLPSGSLDAVVVTGSMPHFPDPGAVLAEAGRLLRPGGLFVCTEEVSLTPAGAEPPADAFTARHPEGVFFRTDLPRRRSQFAEAGLTVEVDDDLTAWASDLLRDRLRAMRLFRGSVDGILGPESAHRVLDTLDSALAEYHAGRLLPRLFVGTAG